MRQEFAPPEDPVFQLVPPEFGKYAGILYESMGSPTIKSDNIWEIYRELLHRFEHLDDAVDFLEECLVYLDLIDKQINATELEPPSGAELYGGPDNLREDGTYYMGGVNNGRGPGKYLPLLLQLYSHDSITDTEMEKKLDDLEENDEDFEVVEAEFTDDEGPGEGEEW